LEKCLQDVVFFGRYREWVNTRMVAAQAGVYPKLLHRGSPVNNKRPGARVATLKVLGKPKLDLLQAGAVLLVI
jgi:hypothetical protein